MRNYNSQREREYELKKLELEARLSYPFTLKMTALICFTILFSITLLGLFFGGTGLWIAGVILLVIFGFIVYSAMKPTPYI